MRAVTLCVCASLVVSVVTAGDLEKLEARFDERLKDAKENIASLKSQQQSFIIEKQASEQKKVASLEDLVSKQKKNIDEHGKKVNIIFTTQEKLALLFYMVEQQKNTIDELGKETKNQTRRLGQYEAGIKKEEETNKALRKKLSSLKRQMQAVKNTNNAQGNKLSSLERQMQAVKNTNNALVNKLSSLESQMEAEKNTNNALGNQLSSLEVQVQEEKSMNTAQASQLTKLTTPQYFSVYLKSETIPPEYEVLVFDGVIDDPKNLYNRTTGMFECQVPGVYVFTLTAVGMAGNGPVWLCIYLNGKRKAVARASGDYYQGSNTVTLTLKRADKVRVKSFLGIRSTVYGRDDYPYTTFSGRLINPTF